MRRKLTTGDARAIRARLAASESAVGRAATEAGVPRASVERFLHSPEATHTRLSPEARARLLPQLVTVKGLAAEYGVSPETVRRVRDFEVFKE